MNERINMQDIAERLAEKHGMDKKDAEAFVKGMFELIEEALISEKYIKVKGLGTFKLIEVDKRESIHVNTGERIEIQGHIKISFTPDSNMKDLINKPFAHFETVILNKNTQLEDTVTVTEGEEEEALNEEQATVEAETPATEAETPAAGEAREETVTAAAEEPATEATTAEENDETSQPRAEETLTIADAAILATEEGKTLSEIIAPKEEEHEEGLQHEAKPEAEHEAKPETGKTTKTRGIILLAIVLIACIAGGIYWYLQSDKPTDVPPPATIETSQPQAEETTPAAAGSDSLAQHADSIQALPATTGKNPDTPVAAKKPAATESLADTVEYDITGTKTSHTLQEGESLAKLAFRFYGEKRLWPYIVRHNKDIIKDANKVPVGTMLRIPELTPKK